MADFDRETAPSESGTESDSESNWSDVGVLQRGHGIRGDVIIKPHNPGTEVFVKGLVIRLVPKGASFYSRTVTSHQVFSVYAKAGKGGLKLTLEGIEDRTHADSLRGARVLVETANLPGLKEGEFFHADLVGLEVIASDLSGSPVIGTMKSVMESPAHDIFVVTLSGVLQGHLEDGASATDGKELLVPCVERFVEDVDVANKVIKLLNVLDLADGLDPSKGGSREDEGVEPDEADS